MKQRGPKSEAAREIELLAPEPDRPEPPTDLTPEQTEVWRAVVDRMPGGWFKAEHLKELAAYTAHVCRERFLTAALNRFDAKELETIDGLKRFEMMSKAAVRESAAARASARTMRITHRSQYDAAKAHRAVTNSTELRPWDYQ